MKQKFSTIFILLLLFLAGSRVVAQNAPKPFDIEQPSLRVFLPAPELATDAGVVDRAALEMRCTEIHTDSPKTKQRQ